MRTAWAIFGFAGVVGATVAALALVGPGSRLPPREPTVYAARGIDAPGGDQLLARLAHGLSPLPADGVRFVAHPASADRDYAFQIAAPVPGGPAKAILVVTPRDGSLKRRHRFNVPGPDARAFLATIDAVLPGIGRAGVDGAATAIERIDGGESRTWTGDPTDPDWASINAAILTLLRTHAPGPDLPTDDDWRDKSA